jgi:hypothetical protein
MKRPSIKEVMRRLDEKGYSNIADNIRDQHLLASAIKDIRPRIKMTTAYKLAEKIQARALKDEP